jgi:oligopeptide transport system substrate-binding protein
MNRFPTILLILLVLSFPIFAQNGPRGETWGGTAPDGRIQQQDPPEENEDQEKKEKEFVAAFSSTDITYNPLHSYTATEAQIYTAIYEGLVTYHPYSMVPTPAVAEKWELSDDKKTYRFFIRRDARYWNGDRILAEHVRNSWLKLLDPEVKAEYSFLLDVIDGAKDYRLGVNDDPETVGIEVEPGNVLTVTLEHPAGHFLKVLCHHSFVPIHPKLLDEKDWKQYPALLGNGPYYLDEKKDDELILKRNDLYWDVDSVKIPDLRIVFIDDPSIITDRFNKDQINWSADGMVLDQVNNKNAIVPNPMFATSYFYFRSKEPPLDDPKVRSGLAYLLPWKEIRNEQFMFIPTHTLVPTIPQYPELEGIQKQNMITGHTLLDEAGFENGKGLPELIIRIPQGSESNRIAELIKTAWEENLEVTVTIEQYSYPRYYNALKGPGYTLGTITWIGDFPDPLTFLQMWTTASNLNDAGYSNPEFDRVIKESMRQSGEERYNTLAEAEEIILSEAVVLPINNTPAFNLIDLNTIGGWYPNPLDIHPFKYIHYKMSIITPHVAKAPTH